MIVSVPLHLEFGSVPVGKELRKRLLRTYVTQLKELNVRLVLDGCCDRAKAIETHRVEGAVVVLSSAVHGGATLSWQSEFLDGMHDPIRTQVIEITRRCE